VHIDTLSEQAARMPPGAAVYMDVYLRRASEGIDMLISILF
jgi:hypothetical protein